MVKTSEVADLVQEEEVTKMNLFEITPMEKVRWGGKKRGGEGRGGEGRGQVLLKSLALKWIMYSNCCQPVQHLIIS